MNSLFKLSNGRKDELNPASFEKNVCRLFIEPISDFNAFLIVSSACVFRTKGVTPSFLIRKPNNSHSVFATSHFRHFKATFDTSSFLRIFSTNAIGFILVPFGATKMSFMNAFA